MDLVIPDRNTWYAVQARDGTKYMSRERWCRDNCQGRWIMNRKITEFELQRDAVAFALLWT
jgi:hypothetical protein